MSSISASSDLLYYTERGAGEPLLLVHGLMSTGAVFDHLIDHFAARQRVIVPDLRGHGRSRGLPPPYTAAQLAADLAGLLDYLGIQSAAVLGYSQGGAIAQQFALDYPGYCNRLELVCTYAFNMATFSERLQGRLTPLFIRMLGLRRLGKLVVSQGLKQLDQEHAGWLAGVIADQDPGLMTAAVKEMLAFDSRLRLAEIRCPALIVAGSKDEAVPVHHAQMLHSGIPGSRLVVIDGADHALLWTHANELVRLTDEFLRA